MADVAGEIDAESVLKRGKEFSEALAIVPCDGGQGGGVHVLDAGEHAL